MAPPGLIGQLHHKTIKPILDISPVLNSFEFLFSTLMFIL